MPAINPEHWLWPQYVMLAIYAITVIDALASDNQKGGAFKVVCALIGVFILACGGFFA